MRGTEPIRQGYACKLITGLTLPYPIQTIQRMAAPGLTLRDYLQFSVMSLNVWVALRFGLMPRLIASPGPESTQIISLTIRLTWLLLALILLLLIVLAFHLKRRPFALVADADQSRDIGWPFVISNVSLVWLVL